MQDPNVCSACREGPFTNLQNHVNSCKESKRREIEFASSIRSVKRHGPTVENEIQKRRQPQDLMPKVGAFSVRFLVGVS